MIALGLDIESGGLDPAETSLLTIGVALANITSNTLDWIHQKEYRVKHAVYKVTPEALRVNRLNIVNFTKESTFTLEEIQGDINKAYPGKPAFYHNLVGHNITFDLGFTRGYPFNSGRTSKNIFDTLRIAQVFQAAGLQYNRVKLQSCCDFHGIEYNEDLAHGALYDAEKAVELFQAQLKVVKQGILVNAAGDLDLS